MSFELSRDQQNVLGGVWEWFNNMGQPYLTIGGYAGTGKTTLLGYIRSVVAKAQPKARVAFCAYTGKATQVLYKTLKGLHVDFEQDSVSTIHSLMYAPLTDKGGGIAGWKRKKTLSYDLILVDEASMIDSQIWQDLLEYEIPIIAVGDHGQLPPISGNFNLMETPLLRLEEVHRQQQNNPIIRVSVMARELGTIPIKDFGQGVRKLNRYDSANGQEVEEMLSNVNQELLILVGYNASRTRLNQEIRQRLGFESPRPLVGDQVICLKNNWEKGIYNGMLAKICRINPKKDKHGIVHWHDVELDLNDSEEKYIGSISAHQFGQPTTLTRFDDLDFRAMGDLFDFGYALTVHKAQGSQAREVLLFEEKNKHMSDDDWRRWLYTGITRAQEKLTIVGV